MQRNFPSLVLLFHEIQLKYEILMFDFFSPLYVNAQNIELLS